MYFQIQDIKFENLFGFASFSIKRGAKIAELSRVNNTAQLQKIGTNLKEFSISMNLNRAFVDVQETLDYLNSYSEEGTAVSIIDGTGKYYGKFIIPNVSQSIQTLDIDGSIIAVAVSIDLKEFIEGNAETSEVITARNNALALVENKPIRILTKTASVSPLNSVLVFANSGKSSSIASIALVESSVDNPNQSAAFLAKAKSKIADANKNYSDAVNTVRENTTKFENVASGYEADLDELVIITNSLKASAENGDLSGAVGFSQALSNQLSLTANSQRPLDIMAITRKKL